MKSLKWGAILSGLALVASALLSACHPTFVVLPGPEGDSVADTVRVRDNRTPPVRPPLRVVDTVTVVRVDTVRAPARPGPRRPPLTRVDTVTVVRVDTVTMVRVDTIRAPSRPGPRRPPLTRVDTIVRVDTVTRVETRLRVDTVVRVDTLRAPPSAGPRGGLNPRVDTIIRVDTVRLATPSTPTRPPRGGGRSVDVDTVIKLVPTVDTIVRVDTLRISSVDTIQVRTPVQVTDTILVTDTLEVTNTVQVTDTVLVTDTVEVTNTVQLTDTVRVVVTDTVVQTEVVRLPGQRVLFVPPGHYPPDGQCRVWIHGEPPGQQARPAPCNDLGTIPAGAFILFGGDAWDFDYDWVAQAGREPGSVPPQIVALQRRGGRS